MHAPTLYLVADSIDILSERLARVKEFIVKLDVLAALGFVEARKSLNGHIRTGYVALNAMAGLVLSQHRLSALKREGTAR